MDINLTKDSLIGDVLEKYPVVKDYLPEISPALSKFVNPLTMGTLGKVTKLKDVAESAGIDVDELIGKLTEKIKG